jgi:hypothetical protein
MVGRGQVEIGPINLTEFTAEAEVKHEMPPVARSWDEFSRIAQEEGLAASAADCPECGDCSRGA